MKNRGDLISGVLLAVLSLWAAVESIHLKIGSPTAPQPGFFPFAGSLLLFVFSGIIVVQACLSSPIAEEAAGNRMRPVALVGVMVVLVAALKGLGYVFSTFIATAFILWLMDVRSWRAILISALSLSIGTYLLFDKLLGVELPVGFLDRFGL